MRLWSLCLFVIMAAAAGSRPCVAGDRDEAILERLEALEAERLELFSRLVPTVAAVFPGKVGAGGGSGVVIDPRGYVLTNFHVVKTEREVKIGLSDGRVYDADVLGIDPTGDIALARLRGPGPFRYARLGDSDRVRMGERVYAMGNPFLLATDFQPTITEGIVGGVHRFRGAGANLVYGDCIQTDAAINPGNSGGPLFDAKGRLIGINGLGGFRGERGRYNVGVGFAASINQISNFLADLRAGGQVQHGAMGATVRDEESQSASGARRLAVDRIYDDSPAWRAGLRLGDIIKTFNGHAASDQNSLLTRLSRLPKGRLVELVVESSARGPGEHFVRFRLEGVASGPKPGTYLRLPKLAKRELDEVLGEYRRAHSVALEKPWRFSWRGQRSVGGQRTPIEVYVYDERFRVDIGAGSARVSLRYDGRRLVRLGGDGGLFEFEDDDELVAARIPATRARFALARARLKRSAKALELEGGALSLGRRCFKLAVRDAEDRYVALYIGERRGRLLGLLRPSDDGDRFVETAYLDLEAQSGVMRPRRIERRDWASGRLLSVDRIEAYGAEVADLAFYQAVGGEALEESRERR